MAELAKNLGRGDEKGIVSNKPQGKANGNRKRTVYDHEMTGSEKLALRTVLAAKNTCTQLAIAIQEGKAISPGAIRSCLELQQHGADMLFA